MMKVKWVTVVLCLVCGLFPLHPILAPPSFLAAFAELIPSKESGWPQFRGPRRDGTSDESGLLPRWSETGPRLLWSVTHIGQGFSSPVISDGRLVITGDVGDRLMLTALDLNGRKLWSAANGASWKGPYPGARASATLQDKRIFHQNAHGRLVCLDGKTGLELWAVDVLRQFGGTNITWGLSECLLADERAVYVTAGGSEALVVALDKTNGTVLWKSPPLYDTTGERKLESAGYVSPILVKFGGRRLLIGASQRYLYCVDADTGTRQWSRPMPTAYSVLAMVPTLVGDAVFMTAPHGIGGRLWRLTPGITIGAEEIWRTELDTCQGGVVYRDGKLFGSFYTERQGWAAIDAGNGSVLFRAADLVKGAPLYADGRLYALGEDGWMLLLEPQADTFAERGRFRLAEARARDAWAHPVVYNGRLYLRYHNMLNCYDVRR